MTESRLYLLALSGSISALFRLKKELLKDPENENLINQVEQADLEVTELHERYLKAKHKEDKT